MAGLFSIFCCVEVNKCIPILSYFTEKQKCTIKLDIRFELGTVEKIVSLDKDVS
jgi:hypothetical protein